MVDRIVNVEHTLTLAHKNERVCPRPIHWVRLYRLLRGRGSVPSRDPPPPLLESGENVPALLKILRLKEQIRWAAAHGTLAEVHRFLEQLREEDWLHTGQS